MSIKDRKKDHVKLSVSADSQYNRPPGFEQYRFMHNALPETNLDRVSTECTLLGRTFSFPLFISSMTGGYTEAGAVNAAIAAFCEKHNLPFGVGSQRIMLEDREAASTFSVVREKAPTAFIAANIGGAQLIGGLEKGQVRLLTESIEADAIIVHLNPLQELVQPEGDRNFDGIEEGIAQLADDSPVPLIVKETGAGISGPVAERLLNAGASVIDTAGAGGTSWSRVENRRASNPDPQKAFDDWGIPTVECIRQVRTLRDRYDFEMIASGGIRSGIDILKSLCLGADFAAAAQPVIRAITEGGMEELEKLYENWRKQASYIMVLTGCEQLGQLNESHLLFAGEGG